jgi:hypothetical protein
LFYQSERRKATQHPNIVEMKYQTLDKPPSR